MKKALLLLSVVLIFPTAIFASAGKKGIGINYPGFSFKYFLSERICLEPKVQFASNIFAGGIRGSYYFSDLIYTGIEANYITFKGEASEGSGIAGSIFAGVEIGLLENMTFQVDMGPVFMTLSDESYNVSGNYSGIMTNIGLNYYFGGGRK